MMRYKLLSLFSGAGGMDLGFKKAGFDIVWANDNFKEAVETYRLNVSDDIIRIRGFSCKPHIFKVWKGNILEVRRKQLEYGCSQGGEGDMLTLKDIEYLEILSHVVANRIFARSDCQWIKEGNHRKVECEFEHL